MDASMCTYGRMGERTPCSYACGCVSGLEAAKVWQGGLQVQVAGLAGSAYIRGWRNTVGNLIEICWLKKAYHGPQFTGTCVNNRGVRFRRIRDCKQYYVNTIPQTSQHDRVRCRRPLCPRGRPLSQWAPRPDVGRSRLSSCPARAGRVSTVSCRKESR